MKAARLTEQKEIDIVDIPQPVPEEDQLLLKVLSCAICKTDAKMWNQGQRDLVMPRILGHEFVGHDPISGKNYAVWPGNCCGVCDFCKSGKENLCPEMKIYGFHRDGGFAENTVISKASLVELDDDIPVSLACLSEPLGCAINALQQAGATAGNEILIQGGGTLGILLSLAAVEMGSKVTLFDPEESKLNMAGEFYKKYEIGTDSGEEKRFDIIINATPETSAVKDGISKLKKEGCYVIFSGFTKSEEISTSLLNEIHYRQLHVIGAYGCTKSQISEALEIIKRHYNSLDFLISGTIGLEEIENVFPDIIQGKSFRYIININ